jgi:hypothetical protein
LFNRSDFLCFEWMGIYVLLWSCQRVLDNAGSTAPLDKLLFLVKSFLLDKIRCQSTNVLCLLPMLEVRKRRIGGLLLSQLQNVFELIP